MDNGFIYYTRSYTKIFLIFSNVFPIFRLLLYFMKKITQHIKKPLIKRQLAGLFFESKEIKHKNYIKNRFEDIKKKTKLDFHKAKLEDHKNNKKEESNEQNNCSNIGILNLYTINKIEYNTKKKFNKNNCKEYVLKNNLNLKEEKPKITLNNKNLFSSSKKNNKSLQFYENFHSDKSQNIYNKHKKEYIFPYFYFLMDFIFDKLLHPEKFFCFPKTYFIVYKYMCQIYDISSHIILFKQVNILKEMLEAKNNENEDEIRLIRKFQKINIR